MSHRVNRESLVLRVSEHLAVLLDVQVIHDDGDVQKWFTNSHKKEMLQLIITAVQDRCKSYENKNSKLHSNKTDEAQKTHMDKTTQGCVRGSTLKVGFKFSKRSVNLGCLLPNKSILCPSEKAVYSGGGYQKLNLFPEKLNIYVCEYDPSRGQQISNTASTCDQAKPSISDYFQSSSGASSRLQTDSAIKRKVKLKRIVQKSSQPKSASTATSTSVSSAGGFLTDSRHDHQSTELPSNQSTGSRHSNKTTANSVKRSSTKYGSHDKYSKHQGSSTNLCKTDNNGAKVNNGKTFDSMDQDIEVTHTVVDDDYGAKVNSEEAVETMNQDAEDSSVNHAAHRNTEEDMDHSPTANDDVGGMDNHHSNLGPVKEPIYVNDSSGDESTGSHTFDKVGVEKGTLTQKKIDEYKTADVKQKTVGCIPQSTTDELNPVAIQEHNVTKLTRKSPSKYDSKNKKSRERKRSSEGLEMISEQQKKLRPEIEENGDDRAPKKTQKTPQQQKSSHQTEIEDISQINEESTTGKINSSVVKQGQNAANLAKKNSSKSEHRKSKERKLTPVKECKNLFMSLSRQKNKLTTQQKSSKQNKTLAQGSSSKLNAKLKTTGMQQIKSPDDDDGSDMCRACQAKKRDKLSKQKKVGPRSGAVKPQSKSAKKSNASDDEESDDEDNIDCHACLAKKLRQLSKQSTVTSQSAEFVRYSYDTNKSGGKNGKSVSYKGGSLKASLQRADTNCKSITDKGLSLIETGKERVIKSDYDKDNDDDGTTQIELISSRKRDQEKWTSKESHSNSTQKLNGRDQCSVGQKSDHCTKKFNEKHEFDMQEKSSYFKEKDKSSSFDECDGELGIQKKHVNSEKQKRKKKEIKRSSGDHDYGGEQKKVCAQKIDSEKCKGKRVKQSSSDVRPKGGKHDDRYKSSVIDDEGKHDDRYKSSDKQDGGANKSNLPKKLSPIRKLKRKHQDREQSSDLNSTDTSYKTCDKVQKLESHDDHFETDDNFNYQFDDFNDYWECGQEDDIQDKDVSTQDMFWDKGHQDMSLDKGHQDMSLVKGHKSDNVESPEAQDCSFKQSDDGDDLEIVEEPAYTLKAAGDPIYSYDDNYGQKPASGIAHESQHYSYNDNDDDMEIVEQSVYTFSAFSSGSAESSGVPQRNVKKKGRDKSPTYVQKTLETSFKTKSGKTKNPCTSTASSKIRSSLNDKSKKSHRSAKCQEPNGHQRDKGSKVARENRTKMPPPATCTSKLYSKVTKEKHIIDQRSKKGQSSSITTQRTTDGTCQQSTDTAQGSTGLKGQKFNDMGQRLADTRGQSSCDTKENTKPSSSAVLPVDDDIVNVSSDDEEEEDGQRNSSLIDVIGDKRDVRSLNDGDIDYLMRRNKQYFKNIFAGKIPCKRHQHYKAGGLLRNNLGHSVRFGPFTEENQDTIVKALIHTFCRKNSHYFDYVTKVLLPEALAKICMDVHEITHHQALTFLAETPSASFCM